MKIKLSKITLISFLCIVFLTGCNQNASTTIAPTGETTGEIPSGINEITDKDKDVAYDESTAVTIVFTDDSITSSDSSVNISGSVATIITSGTYVISGSSKDGQLIVNADKTEDVHLIFKGLDLTCKNSSPVYIISADKTIITLYERTKNTLSDTLGFKYTDATAEEPNATIFSKDSLTINGSGTLTINAKFNNGIQSKDHLKILGGTITVNSQNDALKGKDSVTIAGGTMKLISNGDGITSSNAVDSALGYVNIIGGNVTIDSSEKGIKAESLVYIQQGTVNIDAIDDSINCNVEFKMDGGNLTLKTKDDAIRADFSITITGGNVNIVDCYLDYNSDSVNIKK